MSTRKFSWLGFDILATAFMMPLLLFVWGVALVAQLLVRTEERGKTVKWRY